MLTRLLAFLAGFGKFDLRVFTQRKHAGFTVEFKSTAVGFFTIWFHFEVETDEMIESIEFFFHVLIFDCDVTR
ncbi:hypothetical protein HMPREF0880_03809 [Yokenella regensburgei ATCC 43003]|nr:hypothetical protein HMPREF0880_03809 [Yokenella regensburgei ATCC 43003]